MIGSARQAAAQSADTPGGDSREHLLGIGAAAEKTGVSQRALRYYQQLGLITPCASTPGGLRRYSEDEIAVVLRGEDRMAEIKLAYQDEGTSRDKRQALLRESLDLQLVLRATVEAKRQGIEGFLADLDARIGKTQAYLDQMDASVKAPESGDADGTAGSQS